MGTVIAPIRIDMEDGLAGPRKRVLLRTDGDPTPWLAWSQEQTDGTIVLAVPELGLPGTDVGVHRPPPDPGTTATLTWKTGAGRADLDCIVIAHSPDGSWLVAPTTLFAGGRRRHVRMAFSERLNVRVDGVDVEAVGVDLSSGGLRCELLHPVWIVPGTELALEFAFAESYVLAKGRVLRCGESPHGGFELAVVFDGRQPGLETILHDRAEGGPKLI